MDAAEPEVRKLLTLSARMPATVIAERIGWEHSIAILKDRIRQIRPEYAGVDPADRIVHEPGQAPQMGLWFREPRIPVGFGQAAMLPVLVMTRVPNGGVGNVTQQRSGVPRRVTHAFSRGMSW